VSINFQITIDGPAATGKSTVAKKIASCLGGYYINTGEMFRTLTWLALDAGIDIVKEPQRVIDMLPSVDMVHAISADGSLQLLLAGKPIPVVKIRSPKVAGFVSHLAKIAEVRMWMNSKQRDTAKLGIVVMEGRDIGTVIFPDARFKFYLTASPKVRAKRRLAQSGEVAEGATIATVAAEIAERDRLDSTRKIAPLKPAKDAVIIDTGMMNVEQVVAYMVNIIKMGV